MEARMVHARQNLILDRVRKWNIPQLHKRGIPITMASVPTTALSLNIFPDVTSFLLDLLGDGGSWAGW